jgi:DeoR family fructose operon transcriptional repressor
MYAEERQQAIASLVISQGRASVTELAHAYDVTTETVRRDLAVLDRQAPAAGARRRCPHRVLQLVDRRR